MILLYILFVLLGLFGISYKKEGFYDDNMGRSQCDAIKGLCIILVFIRHIFQYIDDSGYDYSLWGDHYASILDGMTRQLLVAFFLFSSGFGIMESIRDKGKSYIRSIPKRRILTTLLNYEVAVCAFILLDIIIDTQLSFRQIALTFVCWESIGNSNWYIFAILACYIIVYLVFDLSEGIIETKRVLLPLFFSFLFYLLLISSLKSSCWYDTIFCYPAGMLFSIYKNRIKPFLQQYYIIALLLPLVILALLYYTPDYKGIIHNIYSISLCLFIIILTMKVRIGNKALYWLGANLFPLYIYQRLPMLAIYSYDNGSFVRNHIILYILICSVVITIITYLYKYWQIKLK